jgi:hypothetical protein
MKTYPLFRSLLVLFLLATTAPAQENEPQAKAKYIVVPPENTMIVTAAQPECPVRLEEAKLIVNIDKRWDFRFLYDLYNKATKPIKSISVIFWTTENTGGTLTNGLNGVTLLSGHRIVSELQTEQREVIPLTDKLRKDLKIDGKMKSVVILMVEKVTFVDGTQFSDTRTFNGLKQFFDEMEK